MTYRVGIIGCGSIARSHADGYLRVANAEMVAVADPHPVAREQFCEEFGIPNAYASVEEMVAKEDLDIASVCTWHLLHPDCTIDAANGGVPGIICEKPMAIGLGEADRMLDACKKNGTKLVISHQRRFTPGWEKARALMRQKAIGDAVMVQGQVAQGLINWATHTLDIASVCTWHLLHPDCTIDAANGGVPGIICEKPMAIGLGEADRMMDACEKNGTKLVISHQRRFTPGWEKARDLMRQKVIGNAVMVHGQVAQGLINWATHTIDGIRFVLDDPETEWVMGAVERQTDRFERDTPIEDACMGLIAFANGAQALIQADLNRPGEQAGHFQIRGSKGLMEVTERTVRLFNTGGWGDVEIAANEAYRAIGGETNAASVRELIEWLEGGEEHRASGHKARATVEIMMALFESARQHRVVHLPLNEMGYPLQLMIEEGKLPVAVPGRYDIRAFLNPEGMDEAAYRRLRAEGVSHSAAMRQLAEEKQ